jgi:hypothetical protein
MPEPKFPKGTTVKVNNRDIRNLVWYPKLEEFHGQTGTVVSSEYYSTYYVAGEEAPTDVYNYTVEFNNGVTQDNVPQVILHAVKSD